MNTLVILLIANCFLLGILLALASILPFRKNSKAPKERVHGDLKRIKDQINGKEHNVLL